tara:strand:- start:137 stop:535 length:399 start_codon:yes stop_codon:yes gene_type:complete
MEEPVIGYASENYCLIDKSENVRGAITKMIAAKCTESYVVGKDNEFLGKLIINDLINSDENKIAFSRIVKDPLTLNPDLSVLQSIEACRSFVGETIPIINPESKELCGVISEADLFSAYLDLDKQIKDLENG